MHLIDTNIFLEILLSQEKSQKCKEILNVHKDNICISDFSLHSIGVILFRYGKENIFVTFSRDVLSHVKIMSLPQSLYSELPDIKKKYGLDFDDAYQFKIADENGYELITTDKDFDKVKDIIRVKNI